ncbi:hypothetical protein IWQ48_001359 [Labrenzia sp. EL_13]|nr:hypothetical protein [Labrenzia sp. EL_13]
MIKNPHLTTFWFEFADSDQNAIPATCRYGVGITAESDKDAFFLLQHGPFKGNKPPTPSVFKRAVKIDDLDPNHVVPNMKPMVFRGVWFPIGYFEDIAP